MNKFMVNMVFTATERLGNKRAEIGPSFLSFYSYIFTYFPPEWCVGEKMTKIL